MWTDCFDEKIFKVEMRYCQGLTRDTSRVFRVYIEFEGLCTVDKVLQWLLPTL